jgi:hypothetical protein
MKAIHLFIVFLLLTPPMIYTGAFLFHPTVKVGIVGDIYCDEFHLNTSRDAFDIYPDCFEAIILPITFNVSNAAAPSGEYFPGDILEFMDPEALIKEFGVDVILFVINVSLIDNEDNNRAKGGKAYTSYSSAIISVDPYSYECDDNVWFIKHLAIHEVFHLLGYVHDKWNRNGVMDSPENLEDTRLNYFYEFQLPVRLWIYKCGLGQPFYRAAFATSFLFMALWIPYFIGVELLLYESYKKGMKGKTLPFPVLLMGLTSSAKLMGTMYDAFWFLAAPMVLMLYIHQFHYTYEKLHSKTQKDIDVFHM